MSPPLFWVDEVPEVGRQLILDGPEGRHAVTVTRLKAGERILVGDGCGTLAECEIIAVHWKDALTAEVAERSVSAAPTPPVTVIQALPKSERSELAVEQATAAGVDRIVPWQAARCVSRWASKAEKGRTKWQATAAAAAKQSRRPRIPEITPLAGTTDVRTRCADVIADGGIVVVLHEGAAKSLRDLPVAQAAEVVLIVGPEGGLDDAEIADLTALGAHSVLLGPEVLRTSLAAAVALGALGVLTPRWSS